MKEVRLIMGTMGATHLKYASISSSQSSFGGKDNAPRLCRISSSILFILVDRAESFAIFGKGKCTPTGPWYCWVSNDIFENSSRYATRPGSSISDFVVTGL